MVATIYIILFVILLVVIVGYAYWDNYQKSHKNLFNPSIPTTTTITKSDIKPDVKITSTTYPNEILTPGNVLTMDADFLCALGTPEKLMVNTTDDMKKQIFESYHLNYPPTKAYQIDRFIPLSLGGSNNIKNIWPQGVTPIPGYKEKDKVENYLYTLVCNNTINLSTAQQMIKTDWVKVYREMPQ